jgi:hypothetical protein
MTGRRSLLLLAALAVGLLCAGAAAADGGDANVPQVLLETPGDGVAFYQGQSVQAAYACLPGALGWPVISCVGDMPLGEPLDTASAGTHTFTVRAEDYAGAVATVTHSYIVFDVIPPHITVLTPAEQGVYEFGTSVIVDYSCDDGSGGSGIQACIGSLPMGTPLPTNRLGTFSFNVTSVDGAGNFSTTQRTYQVVDRAAPTISISQPALPVGDRVPVYTLAQVVLADYSCTDGNGSGIVACVGDASSRSALDTSTVGLHTFTVVARDAARNSTTASRSYRVVYAFDGFGAPLSPLPMLATASAGSQLPVKFSLRGDFGLSAVAGVSSQQIDCATPVAVDPSRAAVGSLSYNAGPDRYTFQWATDRSWAGTCRQIAVTLDDGTVHRANVRFTK